MTSNGPGLPPPPPPESGLKAALKYTGIPASWLSKRPKLPSRNWLIFIGVTSSITGCYLYDRYQCKIIKQQYVDKVKHLAEEPLHSHDWARKVTVYGAKWPDDDDADRSIKYFRKYVKPILVAAAVDFELVTGNRYGEISNRIADEIKRRRRLAAGIDKPKPILVPKAGDQSPEGIRRRELEGGIVLVGRPTFKEFMHGLKRGWTEGLEIVDKEDALAHALENDGRFDEIHEPEPEFNADVEGEPVPTASKLPSSKNPLFTPPYMRPQTSTPRDSKADEIPAFANAPPHTIPALPPLLFVPFTNYLGFKQVPLMIWDFFNQRQKVLSGAQVGYKLVQAHSRPFDPVTDLDLGTESESYYKSNMANYPEEVEKLRKSFYNGLPKKLETARELARGTREPTKDELNYPPPTEVELRAERLKKESRWRGDVAGWEIVDPKNPIAYDDRFENALRVFTEVSSE